MNEKEWMKDTSETLHNIRELLKTQNTMLRKFLEVNTGLSFMKKEGE